MSKYISVTDTAKLVRAALKRAFPSVKFSVTSKSYSMGASIDVRWTDGPTTETVDQHVKQFSGSTFDGMQDLKEYHTSVLNGEEVHFGADSVHTIRHFSAAFLTDIARKVCEYWGEPMPMIKTYGADQDNAYVADDGVYKRIGGSDRCLSQLVDQEAHKTAAAGVSIPTNKPTVQRGVITATWHDNQWVIAGDTYPHRAIIKDAGARWDKASQSWIISFDPDGVYYTMELPASIRAIVTQAAEIIDNSQAVNNTIAEANRQLEQMAAPQRQSAIPQYVREIDWSAATLYNIGRYGNVGFEVMLADPTKVVKVFAFSPDEKTNFFHAVDWAEEHTPQNDYVAMGDDNEYPRDSIIYPTGTSEPVKPELYVYTMLNRPAGYGTCPEGRVVELDKYNMPSFEVEHYGTVTYARKLTPQEMYKWEMVPQSENAYTYPIGARVLVCEQDEATVIAHLPRNWYGVRYDCNGRSVDRNVKDLAPLPPAPVGEPPAPQPDPTTPDDGPDLEQVRALLDSISEPLTLDLPENEAAIPDPVDVEPTVYEQQRLIACRIIYAYTKLGIAALWAYGKGGGFWLRATATQPARYVSMQEAKQATGYGKVLDFEIARLRSEELEKMIEVAQAPILAGYTYPLPEVIPEAVAIPEPVEVAPTRSPYNGYESWKKYAVTDVKSVEEFCSKYYKPERYTGRGEEYVAACLNSNREHIERFGYALITHHSSITGRDVTFYPAIPAPILSDTVDWCALPLDWNIPAGPCAITSDNSVIVDGRHEYPGTYLDVCSLCSRNIQVKYGDPFPICSYCEGRTSTYEQRKEARIARLLRTADKRKRGSQALRQETHHMAEIMNGQPILVGHHSEHRHRRMIERMHNKDRKAWELSKQAEYYTRRATAAASNRQISSDDPAALLKLREKLAKLTARQEEMKRINKLVKKVLKGADKTAQARSLELRKIKVGNASLYRDQTAEERHEAFAAQEAERLAIKNAYVAQAPQLAVLAGISEAQAIGFLTPDDLGRIGYPSYELTNNNAEVRRITKRIADLEQRAKVVETLSAEIDPEPVLYPHDATVIENALENRIQISFPGKPAPEIIQALKRHGFHWSRSQGVWQRMISTAARYAVVDVLGKALTIPESPTPDGTLILEDGSHLEYERDTVVYEPVYTVEATLRRADAALSRAALNMQNNHSDSELVGVYQHRTTGQLRLAFRAKHSQILQMGIVIYTDGTTQGGYGNPYPLEPDWKLIRPYTPAATGGAETPAEPQQLTLL